MTILKCKMCGGDIQATDSNYGTCDSCGSTMTLPKANDERKANLFNRANHYRRQNEFDKAVQAYENILNEDNADAEAHWGLVLSRYGIEYVEDPASGQMVPTCHRVQSDSILLDADYLATLEYSPDEYTKSLYEEEAKKISDIQKGILAICSKEEPYDVFICYKETTDGGSRTKDSTIAQDIYYHLTNDGYKVFFSRITLEDKLGQQYEPYIFSALNSAKVMLVIGTCKENFSAVWVKNEWSRYLHLMKKDRSRLLIPCYKDMDAYDISDELSGLQSQDMGKIGFIQDILRGVKKVLDSGKTAAKDTNVSSGSVVIAAPGVDSLLTRGHLFLEDSDWNQAKEYFNKVLDIDPKFAPAYIGLLCVDFKLQREDQIKRCTRSIDDNNHYQKAVRFAEENLRSQLEEYNKTIKKRIAEDHISDQKSLSVEQRRIEAEKIRSTILSRQLLIEPFHWENIEWIVLEKNANRVLILSKNILERREYHTSRKTITWTYSSLREYLNGTFYQSFSQSAKALILKTTLKNENNQWFNTNGGADTSDMISLLSISDVVKYFGDSGKLKKKSFFTDFISDKFNKTRIASYESVASWWWLRSPGDGSCNASGVNHIGGIILRGCYIDITRGGIRPAMWLDLGS